MQGVGFRFFTKKEAESLGVNGQVRNLNDGSVEIICSGTKEIILQLISWCHDGPSSSRVDNLEYESIDAVEAKEFIIVR